MANYTFHNPSASAYFVLETVSNTNKVYDSTSGKYASGSFSNFVGSNSSHIVQSDYVWAYVAPPGTSSFDFSSAVTVPGGGTTTRKTGGITVIITP